MKKIFVMLLVACAAMGTMAQTTKEVHGAVIDKNGNPLPGAKVEATGGAESTVTDADGTFTLEVSRWLKSVTATYPGMAKKKMGLKNGNELLFTMHEENKHWFVNAIYQRDFRYENNSVGVMGGLLNNWGWYAKVLIDTDYKWNYGHYDEEDNPAEIPSISIGVIKKLSKPMHLYFGLGYTQCYDEHTYSLDREDGLIVDLGLLYNYKHFNVNLGFSYRRILDDFFEDGNGDDGMAIHIGVGYSF